jgi:metal-responsive CopG/Arc/MetJ family transcriptional regulator
MAQARIELTDYSARVLDVVKGKYGLKNRSDALNKALSQIGPIYVEEKPNENVLRELDVIYNSHLIKHKNRKMTDDELKRLLGL